MRIEMLLTAFKESARKSRMNNHPHRVGCDGSGDISIEMVDKLPKTDPREMSVVGQITRCTSCGYINKTGTLTNKEYEAPGGGYYL